MSHLKSSKRQNDCMDADSILKRTNMVKVSLDESGSSRLGTEAQGSGVFNDLVFWYRQPLQIIRFTGTITQTAWISDSEAVAQVCLNHSPWGGGALAPTGCFDLIGSGLPSAAEPHQICCYSTEEASGRAACQREGREKSECRCRCFHCYAHFICRHCVSSRVASQSLSRGRDVFRAQGKSSYYSYCHQMSQIPRGSVPPRFRDPKLDFERNCHLCS